MNHQYKNKITYFLTFIFLLLNILYSCSQNDNATEIPKEFSRYITNIQNSIEYKEITPYYGEKKLPVPDFLTNNEALEDIETFEYLFKTSYSGYEYWNFHGVNFNSYFSELRSYVKQKDTILIEEFETEWSKILNLIRDGHISLIGKNRHHAYEHKSVYYCDIVVEEINPGKYKVINSRYEKVKAGDLFTQKDYNKYLFKTLSPTGKNQFLIGSLSYHAIATKQLSFNDKIIEVPFFESRLSFAKFNNPSHFNITRYQNIPIVRVSSFANEIYPAMEEFMESAKELKKEDKVIINIMNNGGGSSLFPQTFIQNFNDVVNWETYWATLKSPPIIEYLANYSLDSKTAESPNFRNLILSSKEELEKYRLSAYKKWEFSINPNNNLQGNYNGILIVLANRNVLSAGEAFVGVSESIKNQIFIGENTGGCGMFSSSCGYYLPNSKFIANLPRHLILIPGFEECIGFLPDYWLNTTEPLKEIAAWINDPENYQFTYWASFQETIEKIDLSLVLPEDMVIVKPGPNIPNSLAKFSGKWYGLADGILDNQLVVEKIYDNLEVDAIYAWGTAYQWNIYEPGWKRYKGKFINQSLILTDGVVTITYTFSSDDILYSTYERPGIYSRTKLTKVK